MVSYEAGAGCDIGNRPAPQGQNKRSHGTPEGRSAEETETAKRVADEHCAVGSYTRGSIRGGYRNLAGDVPHFAVKRVTPEARSAERVGHGGACYADVTLRLRSGVTRVTLEGDKA